MLSASRGVGERAKGGLAGWGGGGAGVLAARSPGLRDLGLLAVYLSVCVSIWIRDTGWLTPVPQVCLLQGILSFVLFYF